MKHMNIAICLVAAVIGTLPAAAGEAAEPAEGFTTTPTLANAAGDEPCPITNWVTINEPFPTVTIHWDCIPLP